MEAALQGWHPGQVAVQQRLGYADAVKDLWPSIRNNMSEQHRIFHSSNLHFIPVTTIDENGRPWASIMAGADGNIGFVKSPNPKTLSITARLWDGDPLLDTTAAWLKAKHSDTDISERFLTAGLGIEFSTRRRNKFAGFIENTCPMGESNIRFHLYVNQAMG